MKWGELWSLCSLWGLGSGTGPKEFCALADERILIQMDDAESNRKFRDLICIFVEGLGHFADVAQDVSLGFDVTTATGQQLDFIGAVVGLPRQGYPDARYRVFLEIQIDLILSAIREDANWTGTHNNILKIARTFVGPLAPPITLSNLPPYSFSLDVPGLVLSELLEFGFRGGPKWGGLVLRFRPRGPVCHLVFDHSDRLSTLRMISHGN